MAAVLFHGESLLASGQVADIFFGFRPGKMHIYIYIYTYTGMYRFARRKHGEVKSECFDNDFCEQTRD